MYICYSNIEKRIIHIPSHVTWTLECRPFDDEGNEDGNMYLILEGKEYVIRDPEYWCIGRKLPYHIVVYFYEDMLNVIMEELANNPHVINIDKIENDMIENKYKKKWLDNGYIEIDDNGNW